MKHLVGIGIFLFSFCLSIVLSPSIGASWDEPDNIWAAGVYLRFFQSGFDPSVLIDRNASASYFSDKIFTQEPSLNRYPPFPLYIGGIFSLVAENIYGPLTGAQIIAVFHIASGFFLSLLAVSLYYCVLLFGFSVSISVVIAGIAVLHPTIFGYGLSIIKDSAQVSLFTLSLLLLVYASEKNRKGLFAVGTLVWGCAMATKFNAIYVPVIWVLWRLVLSIQYTVFSKINSSSLNTQYKILDTVKEEIIRKTLIPAIFLVAGGLLIMVLLWPYLWFDPIGRIQEVFAYFTTVGTGFKVFWDGTMYMAGTGIPLPWYPLVHILVGTPIPVLILSFSGIITVVIYLLKGQYDSIKWVVLCGLWIIVPLARTFSGNAAFYDGMRHFLEILPPLLLFSAWGFQSVSQIIGKKLGNQQYTQAILSLGLILYLMIILIHFFPYSAGYVNALIRNPDEVVERDFAGLSIANAVKVAHKHKPGPSSIFVPIGGHLSWYYLTQGDTYVYTVADSDILILINKPSHIIKSQFDAEVYSLFELKDTIKRGNSTFAWIYVKRK